MESSIVVSVAGLGLAVNRLVAIVKLMPWFAALDENLRWWLALILSAILGIVFALGAQFNGFPDLGVSAPLQIAVTGLAIGAAANGYNSLIDAFQAILARLQGTTIAQRAPETGANKG